MSRLKRRHVGGSFNALGKNILYKLNDAVIRSRKRKIVVPERKTVVKRARKIAVPKRKTVVKRAKKKPLKKGDQNREWGVNASILKKGQKNENPLRENDKRLEKGPKES